MKNVFLFFFQEFVCSILVKVWPTVFIFYFWLIITWRSQCKCQICCFISFPRHIDKVQVILDMISNLHFNEESDFSDENTSNNEDFSSILNNFGLSLDRKICVVMERKESLQLFKPHNWKISIGINIDVVKKKKEK